MTPHYRFIAMNCRKASILLISIFLAACSSTSQQPSDEAAKHLAGRLARLQLEKHAGLVAHYVLKGKFYYFIKAPCCDRGGNLYDALGNYVCNPNGGFGGMGDGRCPTLRPALNESQGELIPNPFYRP